MTSAIVQSHSAESFKAFYADDSFWVKGVYTDDVLFKVNGEDAPEIDPETLADVDAVEIVSGDVYFSKDELPEGHFLTSLEGRMGLEDALPPQQQGTDVKRFVQLWRKRDDVQHRFERLGKALWGSLPKTTYVLRQMRRIHRFAARCRTN